MSSSLSEEAPPALTPDSEYVLRTVEERGVRYVRLWFVDVLGLLKSVSIPVSELESALEEGVETCERFVHYHRLELRSLE